MAFSNTSIIPPNPEKPHIQLIKGYWRVSQFKRKHRDKFSKAHRFVSTLNSLNSFAFKPDSEK